jgi:mono/diheme cytochrome c family protein
MQVVVCGIAKGEMLMSLLGIIRVSTTALAISALWLGSNLSWAQSSAEDFKMTCAACHTIGGGRLIGPDLAGVQDRRSEDWLVQFVQSSQTLIQSGDVDAVSVFEAYNGMIMPDAALSESQVKALFAYIATQTLQASQPESIASDITPSTQQPVQPDIALPTPEQIVLGQQLFQGTVRFSGGGPTCNACHDVNHDAVLGGGNLARELTTVFSTMGREGVTAIINNAPFPVMKSAYEHQPITEDETVALVAFLQQADEQHENQQPRSYGLGLLSSGVLGSVTLFGICGFVWRGHRKGSVNQSIYDRQIKSQ